MSSPTGSMTHEGFETYFRDSQATKYMLLVGLTVLFYDHLLTLNHEINYIWRGKVGVVPVIFVLNRYIVPCMLSIDVYEYFALSGPHTLLFCKLWTIIQGYLTVASYMSVHVLVAMRVHALYGGRPWIRRTLWLAGSLFLISGIVITTIGQISVTPHLRASKHHCVNKIPSYLWTVWLPSILFETCLFGLTMYAAVSQLNEGQGLSMLYMMLFRDGICYFVGVSLCTLFPLIAVDLLIYITSVWASAPPTLIALARYFSLAMVNVAGSRLVLNLKAYAAERQRYSDVKLTVPDEITTNSYFLQYPSVPARALSTMGLQGARNNHSYDSSWQAKTRETIARVL